MHINYLAAVIIAASALGLAAPRLAAGEGMPSTQTHHAAHHRVAHETVSHRRGLWPGGPDPYAYSYQRVGYYPYYDSRYWVPRSEMRDRTRYPFRLPGYTSSWGYPLSCKIQGRRNCGVPYEQ